MKSALLLSPLDNVVIALKPIEAGEKICVGSQFFVARANVPAGHKIAIAYREVDQAIVKFGWPIGTATNPIHPGDHVHSHNLRCEHVIDLSAVSTEIPKPPAPLREFTFQGYLRADGKVGTRNYVGIISNVNCSASVARMIADRFSDEILQRYPNVDGVVAFKHTGGCAMKFEGIRHRMTTRVLGGMARHPNIGGFLLVGLGCEQGTLSHLVESQNLHQINLPASANGKADTRSVPVLTMQNLGGTRVTVEKGIEEVAKLIEQVNEARRTTTPASELILATECGGSDGYSGITANPAVGFVSDMIVACGGTTILSETTEIYGAEQLLTRRARTPAVAQKLLDLIDWWKVHCRHYGEELDNNPSVGNKAGGLTTIAEKSLGAVAKGGSTALEAVYDYAEPVTQRGFVVMDSPGFDPASVTGMVAGGANLVVFTTGRGSCFGFKPVPSLKVASNTSLFNRLPEDMDFNAGTIVEGRSVAEVGRELFLQLLDVASGNKTCSEKLGIGDDEFVPWQVGPVL
jgi:altronate dehydratase